MEFEKYAYRCRDFDESDEDRNKSRVVRLAEAATVPSRQIIVAVAPQLEDYGCFSRYHGLDANDEKQDGYQKRKYGVECFHNDFPGNSVSATCASRCGTALIPQRVEHDC